jgi:ATP-dependent DNA ligase
MPPVAPMLARPAKRLPSIGQYAFEPRWEGTPCMAFRDRAHLQLWSSGRRRLETEAPEVVGALMRDLPPRCVVEGTLTAGSHGAPRAFVASDLLAVDRRDLRPLPWHARRRRLEREVPPQGPHLWLTPFTEDRTVAQGWFTHLDGTGLDGVVACPVRMPYVGGASAALGVKHERTATCVVGGVRWHHDGRGIASLLLGLYDQAGRLHPCGVATGLSPAQRHVLYDALAPHRGGPVWDHPWTAGDPSVSVGVDARAWELVRPLMVVEVAYGHTRGDRFGGSVRLVRCLPDRSPHACTAIQLARVSPSARRRMVWAPGLGAAA